MQGIIDFAWFLFAAVVLAILVFCYAIVKYYEDKHESERFPRWVTIFSLSISLFCVFLIPVDIYSVSSTVNSDGQPLLSPEEVQTRSDGVRVLYYILYSFILLFMFGLIPFSYFYYEEDDENTTVKQRILGACKYTIFLIVIIIILLVVGLIVFFVSPSDKTISGEAAQEYANQLLQENIGEASISFSIAVLTLVGYLCWISYTAYGLSAFPIGLIRGRKRNSEDESLIRNKLEQSRAKQQEIESKYLGGKKISRKDEAKLSLLKRDEKILNRQGQRLTANQSTCSKAWIVFRPFLFIFGIVFFLISLLFFISILLTNVDKAINSDNLCGASCGFILTYPKIMNPLDSLFTIFSKFFPLDYIVFGGLILYIFFCSLAGVIKIGIRLLWWKLYAIQPRASPPQGLLLAAVILMLCILTLNMEMTTIAPQYSNYGSQVFFNSTTNQTQPCNFNAPAGNCTMTQIGEFVNRISLRTSFFGVVYYYATWIFLLTFLVGTVFALYRSRTSNIETRENDSDSDEEN